jgi:hypothetical protein
MYLFTTEVFMSNDFNKDERMEIALELLGAGSVSELSSDAYESLEDGYIASAGNVVNAGTDLNALRMAGFDDLANAIAELSKNAKAYDWARENL